MNVSEVMSREIISVTSMDSVKKVAKLMKDENIGALPVIDKGKPVGFVTDRDIILHCVATGYNLDGPISHAMSPKVISIHQDEDLKEVNRLMKLNKVSRVLVTDKSEHAVGIVGLQNLTKEDPSLIGETLKEIKQ
jgi:predicted transcriptional regulator